MFSNISKIVKGSNSVFGNLYVDAMKSSITRKDGRSPELRPSSFPLCSVQVLDKFIQASIDGYYQGSMTAYGGYFTSVGTAAHENIQRYMGTTRSILGRWKCDYKPCDAYGKLSVPTTDAFCPCCGHVREYVEFRVDMNGVRGHIDAVIPMANDRIWIGDYKTSTQTYVAAKGDVHKEHLMQIPSYCLILEQKYKQDVAGFSLLYLARDNPGNFHEKAFKWDNNRRNDAQDVIDLNTLRYTSAVKSLLTRNPAKAVACKSCKFPSDYERNMAAYEPCPWAEFCFSSIGVSKYLSARLSLVNDKGISKVTALTEGIKYWRDKC